MALFADRFEGWLASDFEAFSPANWSSNRFNRPRSAVRDRLLSLLEQSTKTANLPALGLTLWASRADPSLINNHKVSRLRAVITRSSERRAELEAAQSQLDATQVDRFGAWLGLEVDHERVLVQLSVPAEAAIDRESLPSHLGLLPSLSDGEHLRHGETAVDLGVWLDALAQTEAPVDLALAWILPLDQALQGSGTAEEVRRFVEKMLPALVAVIGGDPAAIVWESAEHSESTANSSESAMAELSGDGQKEACIATSQAPNQNDEFRPATPIAPPRRPGSYRPAFAPARPTAVPADRAPIERIVPPTWRPETTDIGRQLRQAHEERDRQQARSYPPAAPQRPQSPDRGPRPQPPTQEGRSNNYQSSQTKSGGFPDRRGSGRPFELGPDPKAGQAVTTLAPGARVRMQAGLWLGKEGVVVEIKGDTVHVQLGALTVKVPKSGVALA